MANFKAPIAPIFNGEQFELVNGNVINAKTISDYGVKINVTGDGSVANPWVAALAPGVTQADLIKTIKGQDCIMVNVAGDDNPKVFQIIKNEGYDVDDEVEFKFDNDFINIKFGATDPTLTFERVKEESPHFEFLVVREDASEAIKFYKSDMSAEITAADIIAAYEAGRILSPRWMEMTSIAPAQHPVDCLINPVGTDYQIVFKGILPICGKYEGCETVTGDEMRPDDLAGKAVFMNYLYLHAPSVSKYGCASFMRIQQDDTYVFGPITYNEETKAITPAALSDDVYRTIERYYGGESDIDTKPLISVLVETTGGYKGFLRLQHKAATVNDYTFVGEVCLPTTVESAGSWVLTNVETKKLAYYVDNDGDPGEHWHNIIELPDPGSFNIVLTYDDTEKKYACNHTLADIANAVNKEQDVNVKFVDADGKVSYDQWGIAEIDATKVVFKNGYYRNDEDYERCWIEESIELLAAYVKDAKTLELVEKVVYSRDYKIKYVANVPTGKTLVGKIPAPKFASEVDEDGEYKGNFAFIDEDFLAPTCTVEGLEFGGWYKDAACTEQYAVGDAITKDIKLYAKWAAAAVDVTYDVFDLTKGDIYSITKPSGTSVDYGTGIADNRPTSPDTLEIFNKHIAAHPEQASKTLLSIDVDLASMAWSENPHVITVADNGVEVDIEFRFSGI